MSNGNGKPDSRVLPISEEVDWAKWAKRGVTATRTGLELFLAMKTRNVALLSLAAASAVELAVDVTSKEKIIPSMDERLRSIGVRPLFSQMQITRFLLQTCRELALPTYNLVTGESGKDDNGPGGVGSQVVVYELEDDCKVYFLYHGTWLEAVYGSTQDDIISALSVAVKREMGNYITLTVAYENWSAYVGLAASDVHLEAYVPPVDVAGFCARLKKFQDKGLNRGVILIGEGGTGKTTFAAELARYLKGRLLTIEAKSLNRVMDSGFEMGKLVTIVNPKVILFDDMDRMDGLDNLFGEMERLNRTRRADPILHLASVNHIEKVPNALRREGRFDEKMMFELPDEPLRRKILTGHLEVNDVHIGRTADFESLVGWTEGMAGSALREVALQLMARDFCEIEEHIEHMKRMKALGNEEEEGNKTSDQPPPSLR